MSKPDFKTPVREFVEQLVAGNYQTVVDLSFDKDRSQAEWIEKAIKEYPGQITLPPESAYQNIKVYPNRDKSSYLISFFLWFDKKEDDLEIRITAIKVEGKLYFTFWDILVP